MPLPIIQEIKSLPYASQRFTVYDNKIYSLTGESPYNNDNKTIKSDIRCCANCIGSCGLKEVLADKDYKDMNGMPLGSGCYGISEGYTLNFIGTGSGPRPQSNNRDYPSCAGFLPMDVLSTTTYKRLYIKLIHNKTSVKPIVYQVHGRILSIDDKKALYRSATDIYQLLNKEINEKIKEGFIIDTLEHDGRKPVVRSIELRQKQGGKYCPILKEHTTLDEYEAYCRVFKDKELIRINKLKDKFVESTYEEKHSVIAEIIESIGLSTTLATEYNGNVPSFMTDFFPDLTYRDFVIHYTS